MRVLVLTNLYPPSVLGGYEAECAAVVDHLRARGDEVHVLTSRFRRDDAPAEDGVRRDLAFLTYDWRGTVRAPAAALRDARTTRAALAELRPDLVFCWNGANLPWSVLRVALDGPAPVAFRVCEEWFGSLLGADQFMRHLLPGERGLRRVWGLGLRAVNRHPGLRLDPRRRARAAVCWNAQALRDRAGMPDVIEPVLERVVHSTAARGPLFEQTPRAPSETPPLLAYVGRIDAAKGADVAVRALGRLRTEHGIPARLELAGVAAPGWRERLERLAAEVGATDALTFAGPLPAEAVARLLARADALLVPSTTFDAFPQVCLEGALARVPVVASAIGGIPEGLHDEQHALLHPPGDDAACARALARTLSEPDETAARTARALQRARDLGLAPYLEAMASFADDALAALRATPGP